MNLMKYRMKNSMSTKNVLYQSQDVNDLNSMADNLDLIIFQKMDLILNQQKYKEMEKKLKSPITCKRKKNNLIFKFQEPINKRITLGKFLMKSSDKKEINENKNNDKDKDNDINKKNNLDKSKNKEKKDQPLSYYKRKEKERQKYLENLRADLKNSRFKIYLSNSDHIIAKRKLGKRYTMFKNILNYLESNNITLYELLDNNPFQTKPYELSKSYDFLVAVKFKNYEYVTEALQSSKKYLFSFDYFGQTAYHWAAKLADLKMLKLLMEFGLYHNQKDFKGRTPLYLAALNNHKEICNYLLINNGNIFLKDKSGLSPAEVAGSKELKYYLFDFMAQPFSNPIYKARIQSFLKEREERIKKKQEKIEEEKKRKLKEEKKEEIKEEIQEEIKE